MSKKNENYDKLILNVKTAFESAGFNVKTDVPVKFILGSKKESDIDILVWNNDLILIIEAKDTIMATDSFEFRTTLNHLDKAQNQIQYHMQALKDGMVLKSLEDSYGICINYQDVIQPLILTSQRKPWGIELNNIPIRNAFEIIAQITRGKWELTLADNSKMQINNWEADEFSSDDLLNYLNPTKKPHNIFLNSMQKIQQNYRDLIFVDKYVLDSIRLAEEMKKATNKVS